MIENSKNKAIKEKPTVEKQGALVTEHFYSGGGEYFPITILASTQAEADEIYINKRIKINK